jgi:histidinol dehydrogenase
MSRNRNEFYLVRLIGIDAFTGLAQPAIIADESADPMMIEVDHSIFTK